MERYLRLFDVADQIGRTERAVYYMIDRGDMRAVRLDGRLRVPESELRRWIALHSETVAA